MKTKIASTGSGETVRALTLERKLCSFSPLLDAIVVFDNLEPKEMVFVCTDDRFLLPRKESYSDGLSFLD